MFCKDEPSELSPSIFLCALVDASSPANHWPLGTAPSPSGLVSVGHPAAENSPPSPRARVSLHHQLDVSLNVLGANTAASWCRPRATCQPWGSESGNHSCWSPRSRALRMLISKHKTSILPKLTWQRLPKARVSAGKGTRRLLPTDGPSASGRARIKGYTSHGGARIGACPGGESTPAARPAAAQRRGVPLPARSPQALQPCSDGRNRSGRYALP